MFGLASTPFPTHCPVATPSLLCCAPPHCSGNFTAADFYGPLSGKSSADFMQLADAGQLYVNVHSATEAVSALSGLLGRPVAPPPPPAPPSGGSSVPVGAIVGGVAGGIGEHSSPHATLIWALALFAVQMTYPANTLPLPALTKCRRLAFLPPPPNAALVAAVAGVLVWRRRRRRAACTGLSVEEGASSDLKASSSAGEADASQKLPPSPRPSGRHRAVLPTSAVDTFLTGSKLTHSAPHTDPGSHLSEPRASSK